MYDFLESDSVPLSNIARILKEDILLKKIIERLSRNLSGFNEINKLTKNYIDSVKLFIDDSTIFCIDGSEITKRNSKVLEDMGTVRDGSTGETNVNGYNILEVAALTSKYKMSVSVYSKIFSNASKVSRVKTLKPLKPLNWLAITLEIQVLEPSIEAMTITNSINILSIIVRNL